MSADVLDRRDGRSDDQGGALGVLPEPVEVRRNAGLAALVGVAACALAIAYLARAVRTGAPLDWVLVVLMAVLGVVWLRAFVDARVPLLVADTHGVRLRLGRTWRGVPWSEVAELRLRPRAGLLRDGRLTVAPYDEERVLADLDPSGRRQARWATRLYGAPLAVPLGLTTRVVGDRVDGHRDLASALRGLAGVAVSVVEDGPVDGAVPVDGDGSDAPEPDEAAAAPSAAGASAMIDVGPEPDATESQRRDDEADEEADEDRAGTRLEDDQEGGPHVRRGRDPRPALAAAIGAVAGRLRLPHRGDDDRDEAGQDLDEPWDLDDPEDDLDEGLDGDRDDQDIDAQPRPAFGAAMAALGGRLRLPRRRDHEPEDLDEDLDGEPEDLAEVQVREVQVREADAHGVRVYDGQRVEDPAYDDPAYDALGDTAGHQVVVVDPAPESAVEVTIQRPVIVDDVLERPGPAASPRPAPVRDLRTGRRSEVTSSIEPRFNRTAAPVEPIAADLSGATVSSEAIQLGDESAEGMADPVIGPQLAAARTRLGLGVDQLADRTRIRPHVIEAIEVDDFGPCGGDFYARGHLRTLARVLGVEAPPLLADYDERYADAPIDPRRVFEAELAGNSLRDTTGGPNWTMLVGAVMALVLAWSVARLFLDQPGELRGQAPVFKAAATPRPATLIGEAVPIRLTASRPVHVVVRNAEGRIVFTGDLTGGQQRRVRVVPPVKVAASHGNAVSVTVDGEDQGAVGDSIRQAVHRYEVP